MAPPIAGIRVPLVENHAGTRRVPEPMLRRRGYEVETTDAIEDGAHAATGGRLDLLISDTHLPDGEGHRPLAR